MKNQGCIRLVSWNIEKGKRWPLIEKCLEHDSIRTADVLCLQECDDGMVRSGNRRIAFEIANRLSMQIVFGQTFKEFTKGIGEELLVPGQNTTAVQGNAILSRYPILDSNNLPLPMCADPTRRVEKREGFRCALILRLDCGSGRSLVIANTHLEVFGTMRCRARQVRCILDQLPSGPAILAGDLNTNTFDRGSLFHSSRSLLRLLQRDVKQRVLSPSLHEPLFSELRSSGFSWTPFNDSLPTCSIDLGSLEDQKYFPPPIRNYILSHVRILPLRLDFIACRNLHAVVPGLTITSLPCQPSDHLPITCDISFDQDAKHS